MKPTLSIDHRVLDGAAAFLPDLTGLLERPGGL